jgi:hypothetical protein
MDTYEAPEQSSRPDYRNTSAKACIWIMASNTLPWNFDGTVSQRRSTSCAQPDLSPAIPRATEVPQRQGSIDLARLPPVSYFPIHLTFGGITVAERVSD